MRMISDSSVRKRSSSKSLRLTPRRPRRKTWKALAFRLTRPQRTGRADSWYMASMKVWLSWARQRQCRGSTARDEQTKGTGQVQISIRWLGLAGFDTYEEEICWRV